MSRALAFGTGDLNPHNFLYPTFFFYPLFGWIGLFFRRAPSERRFSHRLSATLLHRSDGHLPGRPSARSGRAGAVRRWLTAVIGRQMFDRPTGLVAAALLAVAPLAVMDSTTSSTTWRQRWQSWWRCGVCHAVGPKAAPKPVCRPSTWSSPRWRVVSHGRSTTTACSWRCRWP